MNQLISWGVGATAAACMTAGAVSAFAGTAASPTSDSSGTDHAVAQKIASLRDTKHRLDQKVSDRAAAALSTSPDAQASPSGTQESRASAAPPSVVSAPPTSAGAGTASLVYRSTQGAAAPTDAPSTPTTTVIPPTTTPPTTEPQGQWTDDDQSSGDDASEQGEGDD